LSSSGQPLALVTSPLLTATVETRRAQLATAEPTGDPWLDANLWRALSLRGQTTRPVWFAHQPDSKVPAEEYRRAVADAALGGGRWVVGLDDQFRHRMRQGDPQALSGWRGLIRYLKFQVEHADWLSFAPKARVGVLHELASQNALLAGENLNLLARRHIPFLVLERAGFSERALEGLEAVVAVDLASPAPGEQRTLTRFAEQGALVIVGPTFPAPSGGPADGSKPYRLLSVGKGRMAVYQKSVPDPYGLSLDALTLIGRNNLGLRVFNVASILTHLSSGPGGRTLLQLVNYGDSPVESVNARVAGRFVRARLYTPEEAAVELTLEQSGATVEFTIPKVSIWAGVVLE